MDKRAVSVHAHFYQPPREDPLSGEIPVEAGAEPYPNWNERVFATCYEPNARLGNFSRMSFDLGPTLVDWMDQTHQETLKEIIEQERSNWLRYGVGNALAQPYHHIIMPLAKRNQKITEARWGIADFERHFGHRPEGMWLPEAAVDTGTLEVLAEEGIRFTILAPCSAGADGLDVSHPYRILLPGGKEIAAFFYDAAMSSTLSFNPAATSNADVFMQALASRAFRAGEGRAQLVMLASDGELYGHHQPFRDYFLSRLVDGASAGAGLEVSFPGLWLRENPPDETIGLRENTSWSCEHGLARWSQACACTPNGTWKAPLRKALERLGQEIDRLYLESVAPLGLADPWEPRHRYLAVMHGDVTDEELLGSLTGRRPESFDVNRISQMLQAQVERLRMFTSCGWFFDDFDRIEPRNNVQYAARAVQLTLLATGVDLTQQAATDLSQVRSPRTGLTADRVFLAHLEANNKALRT